MARVPLKTAASGATVPLLRRRNTRTRPQQARAPDGSSSEPDLTSPATGGRLGVEAAV